MKERDELTSMASGISVEEAQVRQAAFRLILTGSAAGPERLAQDTGLQEVIIRRAVQALRDRGLVTTGSAGRVTGCHGLSVAPTHHRIRIAGNDLYTWCALDAVGIPAALGEDAEIQSACQHCSKEISLRVQRGEVARPEADRVHIASSVGPAYTKVVEDVCPTINFFCTRGDAEEWSRGDANARIMSIKEAAGLGRQLWADVRRT